MRMFFKVTRIEEDIKLPERSTKCSAGYDIFSIEDFVVPPKGKYMLKTGVKVCMPNDEVLQLNVRSSMGKKNIMMGNTIGWVDSDYYNNPDNERRDWATFL